MNRNRWVGWILALAVATSAPAAWSGSAPSLDDFLKQIQDENGEQRREAWEKAGPLGAETIAPLE